MFIVMKSRVKWKRKRARGVCPSPARSSLAMSAVWNVPRNKRWHLKISWSYAQMLTYIAGDKPVNGSSATGATGAAHAFYTLKVKVAILIHDNHCKKTFCAIGWQYRNLLPSTAIMPLYAGEAVDDEEPESAAGAPGLPSAVIGADGGHFRRLLRSCRRKATGWLSRQPRKLAIIGLLAKYPVCRERFSDQRDRHRATSTVSAGHPKRLRRRYPTTRWTESAEQLGQCVEELFTQNGNWKELGYAPCTQHNGVWS